MVALAVEVIRVVRLVVVFAHVNDAIIVQVVAVVEIVRIDVVEQKRLEIIGYLIAIAVGVGGAVLVLVQTGENPVLVLETGYEEIVWKRILVIVVINRV